MIPHEGFKTYVLEEYNNLGECSQEKKIDKIVFKT